MKRTLSSPSVKLLFLFRALGGCVGAAVTLDLLVRIQASLGTKWELVAAGVAVVAIVGVLIVRDQLARRDLKRVAVDDRYLYVSDDADAAEVAIPLREIVRVTQWRGRTFRPVSIYLRSPSTIGTRIRFQPQPDSGWAWKENAVVDELRQLAGHR